MRHLLWMLLAIALTGCKPNLPTTWKAHPYGAPGPTETIHFADPDGDLKAALAAGDQRFVGIMGNALGLPGVPSPDQPYFRTTYGAKVVSGISDVENETSERIGGIARDYATKYNTALLLRLEQLKATTQPPQ